MADLNEALNKWYEQVDKAMTLSADDKDKITGAGAEVFSKILHDYTPRSNIKYTRKGRSAGHANKKHGNKHRKTKHLQDTITYKAGYLADGFHTGDTDVGWDNHYYDFLAKIVNNGVHQMSEKQIANKNFYDRALEASKDAVIDAEKKAYEELMGNDGG